MESKKLGKVTGRDLVEAIRVFGAMDLEIDVDSWPIIFVAPPKEVKMVCSNETVIPMTEHTDIYLSFNPWKDDCIMAEKHKWTM